MSESAFDRSPTVLSVVRADGNPTNTASVNFKVTFSEPVNGVDAGDFTLTTSGSLYGTSVTTANGSGNVYSVSVNTGSQDGTLRLTGLAAMVGQRLVADTRQYVLKTLDHQTQSQLDALESGLQHQILLTRVLSNDSRTRVFTAHPTAELAQEVNEKLAEFVARQPVSICFLMDRSGKVLASSNYDTAQSFVGNDYSFRGYFKDALAGKIGISLHVGVSTSKRGVFIACPVRGDDAIVGVLVTKDELSIFEDRLKDSQALIQLADSNGFILVSNRPQWEGLTIDPINPEQRTAWQDGRQYGKYSLDWSGIKVSHERAMAHIQSQEYLFMTRQLAMVDWRLLAFAETHPVEQIRYMAIALGALLAIAVGGAFLWIQQNRRFQRRLAQSERLYRGLYEASADALLLVDQEDGIVDCNDMALQLFGFENQLSLHHKLFHELAPAIQSNGEESREVEIRLVAHAMMKGSARFEWTLCRSDGTLIPTETLLTRVSIDGKSILIGRRSRTGGRGRARERRPSASLAVEPRRPFLAERRHAFGKVTGAGDETRG